MFETIKTKIASMYNKARRLWVYYRFVYFYNWQSIFRFGFSVVLLGPVIWVFVIIPQWVFSFALEMITDYYPERLKVGQNPEWQKMDHNQQREYLRSKLE